MATNITDADCDTKVQTEESGDEDKIRFDTGGSERMIITNAGLVGIGSTAPTQILDVEGRVTISPSGTSPDNAYDGGLIVTRPSSSGQYINLIRSACYPWSIGTVYNTNTFAIGTGQATDSSFTAPEFVMDTSGNVGIGTTSPNSRLHVNGSIALKRTSTASNYTTVDEVIIGVTDTSSARTITLATADCVEGRLILIKDESGNAGTNNITIATQGSENIDGSSTATISTDRGSVRVYSDGSDWFTI